MFDQVYTSWDLADPHKVTRSRVGSKDGKFYLLDQMVLRSGAQSKRCKLRPVSNRLRHPFAKCIHRRQVELVRRRNIFNAENFFRLSYGSNWRHIADDWPADEAGIPKLSDELSNEELEALFGPVEIKSGELVRQPTKSYEKVTYKVDRSIRSIDALLEELAAFPRMREGVDE